MSDRPSDSLSYDTFGLDRADRQRKDPQWVAARLHARDSFLIPVWRDHNLILPGDDDHAPSAVTLTGDHARGTLHMARDVTFLGQREGRSWFTADLSDQELFDLTPIMGRAEFLDLRGCGAFMDPFEAAMLAYARGMLFWHRRQRFCGACGSPTEAHHGGHKRTCGNADCGLEHFPRTDPAVLVLITRPGPEGGACLLARQPAWPDKFHSCLAGFLEIGESLEACARREVMEEVGIEIEDIVQVQSQPWPFPASLMVGMTARARTVRLRVDTDELETARWVTRRQFDDLGSLGIVLPRRDTMARFLIEGWLRKET
ncbi:NAD(+) diphosphatase [Magnetospira sp. QH-2]|uniref:NAD(+) diphosphatase n=1 Tax=Magnetospira sp. (strain QH-2) TaxID=1288970 RepID=UPI0003E80F8F|nr:NAD(+) diphosphatase [Magnetospira sp. QH-2]CCQ75406.1 putative NUDIX hydrolase [Magnetospira sp. QH-2]